MLVKEGKKKIILASETSRIGSVYREILGLLGRFRYLSIEEVMYGFDLSEQDARNRLNYLVRQKLLRPFNSFAHPQNFYCLTKEGFDTVHSFSLSDEINEFNPDRYRPFIQNHDRTLVRIFCALKKMLGSDFQAWISEHNLRQEESLKPIFNVHKEPRVLDGLFQMNVHKEKFIQNSKGQLHFHNSEIEPWWCGLELELSLKSASRYRKQFKVLSECVYDRIQEKQTLPLMFFLCGTPSIQKALIKHQQGIADNFGRCIFIFGQVDSFLKGLGQASLIRLLRSESRDIKGHELNHAKVKVTP